MFVPLQTQQAEPLHRFPVVTVIVIAINVAVFALQVVLVVAGGQAALNDFVATFGVVPAEIVAGQELHTLLTAMFVHAGLLHIGFNMLYLWVFGGNIEDHIGRVPFVVFYLGAGLAATLAQIAVNPSSQVPTVGASGAVAGVLSGYVVLHPRGRVRMFLFLGPFSRIRLVPALAFIALWFITQLWSGVASLGVETAETGGVAYWAHLGGFLTGLVLAAVYRLLRFPHRQQRRTRRGRHNRRA
jgi:membrane associated rhomboid family serine protease